MAFPTVEAVQESPNQSGPDHTCHFPATVNEGDLLLLVHTNFNDFIEFQNDGSGWTELYDVVLGSVGRGQAWVKEAAGDEGGGSVNISNEVNYPTGTTGSAQMYRISGWSGTLNPGTAGIDHGTAGGSSDTPNPPSITAPWGSDDNLWIAAGHAADDDASWNAAPADYTNLFSTLSGGGTNNSGSTGSARRENATGTEDPSTFTLSELEGWLATTFVIEPSTAGGDTTLTADSGTYSVTGSDADLLRDLLITGESGSYSVSGSAADLLRSLLLDGESGSYSVSGQDADLLRDLLIDAESGSYTVVGSAADLLRALLMSGDAGTYSVTGSAADLIVSTGVTLTADPGSYSVTGADADLLRSLQIEGEPGSYTVSGQPADLLRALLFSAEAGDYTVSGQQADLLRQLVMSGEAGSYSVSGAQADLLRDLLFDAEAGSYAVSGEDAQLVLAGELFVNTVTGEVFIARSLSGDAKVARETEGDVGIAQTLSGDVEV